MRATIAAVRDKLLRSIIAQEVAAYVGGRETRRCAFCGRSFEPRHRYHFFCPAKEKRECRRAFYRGIFRPRPE